MTAIGQIGPKGHLNVKVMRDGRAPLWWNLRWKLRTRYITGALAAHFVAPLVSTLFPITTATAELRVRAYKLDQFEQFEYVRLMEALRGRGASEAEIDEFKRQFRLTHGRWIDYGVVSYRVVTDAGVAYLVDQWGGGAQDIANFIYHGCGSGSTAEAAGDTALVTEFTTQIDPDSTRATGVQTQPASNQLRSTATVDFDASVTVNEHGVFEQAAVPGGALWDRSLTGGQAMDPGEAIQFEYTVTLNSGS